MEPQKIIANPYMNPFQYHQLSTLVLLSEGKTKKSISNNQNIWEIGTSYLGLYGIQLLHKTELRDCNNKEIGVSVRASTIQLDFPIENIFLFNQMYGVYENAVVNIGLSLPTKEDCAYNFDLNIDTGECVFRRDSYKTNTHQTNFNSIAEMLNAIRDYLKQLSSPATNLLQDFSLYKNQLKIGEI